MTERKKGRAWMYLLAGMILLAALVIALVLLVYGSSDAGFLETAWRTDAVLTVISFGLLLAILIFCWCALRWRRRPGN